MHTTILSPADAGSACSTSQVEAVVRAAEAWLVAPLGAEATSLRAFVRNRADDVLDALDSDAAAAVYAVIVANYNSWDDDLRAEPLELQAMVLELLLTLERKLQSSSSVGVRLARPLVERANAIRRQADALVARLKAEARRLRQKAARLNQVASYNEAKGYSPVAEAQRAEAAQLMARAQSLLDGKGDHPLVAEIAHLRSKEQQVRKEAAALRALPSTLARRVREAIACAITPEAAWLLGREQHAAALRLATPLSAEWRDAVRARLRFANAGEALLDAWAKLAQPSADIRAVLQKLEDRLFLRRMAGDPSLRATAPETVARALFPHQSPFSITVEMAMVRLVEELRRAIAAPAVDAQLLEKIGQLSAYAEATGDRRAVSRLIKLQHKAALDELKAERRAAAAIARRKAARQLRVRVARRLAHRV